MSTRTFTVTVRDGSNNAPVVGALVTVYYFDEYGQSHVLTSGYTNNQGQFSFTATVPPEYMMTVEKSGYAPFSQPINQNTPSNITITLQRTGQPITQTITVRVVNRSTNNPIAGAQVVVRQGQTTVAQGTTNASGEVQFTLNEGATYTIEASANNFHSNSTSVTIPLSNPLVTISLEPLTQTITVRVVDVDGRAIANAVVVVRQGQTTIAQTTTNASGEVQFNLPYGSYTIQASATGYRSSSTDVTIPLSNPVVTLILTSPRRQFTVTVLDSLNIIPVDGALVKVYYVDEFQQTREHISGHTDSQGRFSFTATFPPNTYTMTVEKANYFTVQQGINEYTPSNITIRLQRRTQTIIVRVVSQSNNSPIAGVQVVVTQNQITVAQAITNASGEAQFTLNHGTTYTIRVFADGSQLVSTSVTIPLPNPPSSPPVVTISLASQTQTITVRVMNQSNNSPISGARILVGRNQTIIAEATTNASGEAQFTLLHGTYTIHASATGFQAGSASVSIPLSNPVVTINLTPLSSQTTVVRVVERNNRAVANALVVIKQGQTTITQTTTNAFGEVYVNLPQGSYSLEVSATHFQPVSMNITVPVPNNLVTVTLQRLTQTITFVLINNANNVSMPNILVSVLLNNVSVSSGTTDQQGRISITLEHGFTYLILVLWGEGRSDALSIPSSTTSFTYRIAPQFRLNVRNQAGADMSGITVIIENLSAGTSRTITGASSPVAISISNSGRHRLTVKREGWKPVVREYEYSSTDQRGLVEDTITMSPTSLTVIARDPRGNPVRGALVRVIKDGSVIRSGYTT